MARHVRGGLTERNLVRKRYFYREVKEETLKRLQEPLPNLDDKDANWPLSEWCLGLNRSQKADVHKTIKHLASRANPVIQVKHLMWRCDLSTRRP